MTTSASSPLAINRAHRFAAKVFLAFAAYSIVGVIVNALTPSPRERALWLPVAVVLVVWRNEK